VQLVRTDGSIASGAEAVFGTVGRQNTYKASRIFAALTEFGYRVIARNRNFFYHVTRFTFGTRIEPSRFEFTQTIFLRALAVSTLAAFGSLSFRSPASSDRTASFP